MTKRLKGVVHGRTIELTEDPGDPDGQDVRIDLEVMQPPKDGEKKG